MMTFFTFWQTNTNAQRITGIISVPFWWSSEDFRFLVFIWWALYFSENICHFLAEQLKMISVGRGVFLYHFEVILKIPVFEQGEGSTSHPVR